MIPGLNFEIAPRAAAAATARADVACFVGYVARRTNAPLPVPLLTQLREAGWASGPWARPPAALESLLHVPVVIDSWDRFDQLYAWEQRPLLPGRREVCASYLGAAVRSYFAQGGRRAVVIRVGDPWSYRGGALRKARRLDRLRHLLPMLKLPQRPFAPTEPGSWRGVEHLYGLPEVSHLCLPDLADICAPEPAPSATVIEPPPAAEVFTECSEQGLDVVGDVSLRGVSAPQLDNSGFVAWRDAVAAVRTFLGHYRRDALFIGHLPLARAETRLSGNYADGSPLDYLERLEAIEQDGKAVPHPSSIASAFVQLGWPWLNTLRSADLPESLEPPDGLLAGLLAAHALSRGTFRSAAGARLGDVIAVQPEPDLGAGRDHPGARLAARVCLIGPDPGGIALLSDVTTSASRGWRQGGSSRLMAALLRNARAIGDASLFEANGPVLWRQVARRFESLLDRWWDAGALGGATRSEAFEVRCDRSTMSQNDLDNGRLRVQVTVRPAVSVEQITVVLDMASGGLPVRLREVA